MPTTATPPTTTAVPADVPTIVRTIARAFEDDPVTGLPAYLESSTTQRNRALYLRHGFEVVEEIPIADDRPSVWRIWREAGA